MEPLRVAVPKGRLLGPLVALWQKAGLLPEGAAGLSDDSRRLTYLEPAGRFLFLLVKPADVPTYVEHGAADLGVVGKDVLWEAEPDVCELVDLGVGPCRMIVAVLETSPVRDAAILGFNSRVGTKFPKVARRYFEGRGIQVEVINLHGSIELAPLVGLAEAIVDLTALVQTLVENGLVAIKEIGLATARLIANRISYKTRFEEIGDITRRLVAVTGE
jgi:ATP phosphoribosyltransferase